LLKIHVLQVLLDSHIGGPQRRSLMLASRLKEYRIVTSFCVPKLEGPFAASAQAAGFQVFCLLPPLPHWPRDPRGFISVLTWLATLPGTSLALRKLIAKEKIDVIHVNGYLGWHAALAARNTGVPLVYHVMGTMYPHWLIKWTRILWASSSQRIIATADMVAEYYLGNHKGNALIMYDPVDVDAFSPERFASLPREELKERLGVSRDGKLIVSVGNVNPAKGFQYLIEAISILRKEGFSVKLLIVGAVPETQRKYYQSLAILIKKHTLEKHVIFLGRTDDIAQLLALADLFVLSSVTEGTPMAILEAMAMKLPVIATDVGAIRELLEDGKRGLLVPPRDPKALARAISQCLANQLDTRMLGRNARQWVVENCPVDSYTDRLAQLYFSFMRKPEGIR